MSNLFFEKPIINSPYQIPSKHWELDKIGQPTQNLIDGVGIAAHSIDAGTTRKTLELLSEATNEI